MHRDVLTVIYLVFTLVVVGAHKGFLVRSELALHSRAALGNGWSMCMVTRHLEWTALGWAGGSSFAPPLGIPFKNPLVEIEGSGGFRPRPSQGPPVFSNYLSILYTYIYKFLISPCSRIYPGRMRGSLSPSVLSTLGWAFLHHDGPALKKETH